MALHIDIEKLLKGNIVEWERLHITESRSTGFPKIYRALKKNGSPAPVFETDEHNHYFLATIKIHEAFIDERAYLVSIGKELDEVGTEGEATPQVPPKSSLVAPRLPPSCPPVPSKLQQLIDYMGEDFRSLDEIMSAFGHKDKKSFRANYITPALAEGIIERKYPDTPNHPYQKFRLTIYLSTDVQSNDLQTY